MGSTIKCSVVVIKHLARSVFRSLPQVSLTGSLGGGCGVGGGVTPNILASLEYRTEAEAVGRASEKELGQGSMRRFVGVLEMGLAPCPREQNKSLD